LNNLKWILLSKNPMMTVKVKAAEAVLSPTTEADKSQMAEAIK